MTAIVLTGLVPVLVLADVLIKSYVEGNIAGDEQHKLFGGRVIVRKVYNRGMCLNAFEDYPDLVRVVSLFATVLLTLYHFVCLLWQKRRFVKNIGLALMTAGAWSNTIDRCVRRYVIDYFGFETKWKRLKGITFNLGDLFVFLGSALVVLASLLKRKRQ